MSARKHHIKVSLSDQEAARLDDLRGDEERAVYLRRLLREPPRGDELATHGEAMAVLTRLARDGKVVAAVALEKALRGGPTGLGAGGLPPWQLTSTSAQVATSAAGV